MRIYWVLTAYCTPGPHRLMIKMQYSQCFQTHVFVSSCMFWVSRCYAGFISDHMMQQDGKPVLKKRDHNFKSLQNLLCVKAENLAKMLTNDILFSAQETSTAARRKMCAGIGYTEQGQRAAIFQVDREQEVCWRPLQKSWQNFNCEITKILAKIESGVNCHMSLDNFVEINPLAELSLMKGE